MSISLDGEMHGTATNREMSAVTLIAHGVRYIFRRRAGKNRRKKLCGRRERLVLKLNPREGPGADAPSSKLARINAVPLVISRWPPNA